MATIWKDASGKGFDSAKVNEHVKANGPGIINQPETNTKWTPLIYAIKNSRPANVDVLLDANADVEKKAEDGSDETPLHFAAVLGTPGRKIVSSLLAKRPKNFDDPRKEKNETPLMVAVRSGKDAEIVKLLVRFGASTEKKNSEGKSAIDLANELPEPPKQQFLTALKEIPDRDRGGIRTYFSNWAIHVLAFFNKYTPLGNIFAAVSKYFYGVAEPETPALTDGPLPEEEAEAQPGSEEWVKGNLQDAIDDKELGRFYPEGDPFLDDLAKKVAELANDPNNSLKEPPELQGLADLALYQPVIYCDDSASMRDNWNTEKRWDKQRALVKRITEITNRAVPGKRGAHLRFMNQNLGSEANGLRGEQIEKYLIDQPSPNNWTPTGTGLRNNVLNPFVYDVINGKKDLERPLLVIITTDGCPWVQEDANKGNQDAISVEFYKFRDEMLECAKFLEANKYRKNAVVFCLNQIGSHPDATWFMGAIGDDQKLKDAGILHLTADRLDSKDLADLQDMEGNQKAIESWLLEVLLSPLKTIRA